MLKKKPCLKFSKTIIHKKMWNNQQQHQYPNKIIPFELKKKQL